MIEPKRYPMDELNTAFFEHYVKGPLRQAIISLLKKYPDVTREDCTKENALVWLDIRDEYLRLERRGILRNMAKLFFNLIISEYQHDSPYEERIDYIVLKLVISYLLGEYKLKDREPALKWGKKDRREINFLEREKQIAEQIVEAISHSDMVLVGVLEKQLQKLQEEVRGD